jgi:nucleoside-diphosphate kinase
MESSLILIKPDAVQRGLIGEIITHLEQKGLKMIAMKMIHLNREMAERHYDIHRGKPFFEGLIAFITSSPVIAIVIQGDNVVEIIRHTMGETNPAKSAPGTIRGDFALTMEHNLIHGSDSPENAAKEIELFFSKDELYDYSRDIDRWT